MDTFRKQSALRREAPENYALSSFSCYYRCLSRVRDLLLASAALLALWPLMVLTAAVIVLNSPGSSPIFAQTRVGLNGRPFTLYKFRTMVPGAEHQLPQLLHHNQMRGPAFKIENDPRITPVGKFLRRSNLDELPQLINVLKGDMAIVGPRPALPREVDRYGDDARVRLTVLPGMTCYWQVQPRHNLLDFDEWMALDRKYIREQSLYTDIKIMAATVAAVLRMDGM